MRNGNCWEWGFCCYESLVVFRSGGSRGMTSGQVKGKGICCVVSVGFLWARGEGEGD